MPNDLPIDLDRAGPPLPVQIADAVRDLIARGVLRPGERLPASRPLADRLAVSRGTVVAGWDQLIAEGYLQTTHGSGTVVNPDLARVHPGGDGGTPAPAVPVRSPDPLRRSEGAGIDLRPGRPDVAGVADSTWRHAWRVAAADPGSGPTDPAGLPALRAELAAHLRQMRGLLVEPAELLVTNGARDGLSTVLQVLAAARGRLTVAVENPGYPSLRQVPRRLGADVVEIDVDDEGLVVTGLDTAGRRTPDLVMVTPSHQYPMGASMTVTRRLELLAWAARHDAIVVEDDYDSELRYVGAPLPALAALDRRENPSGVRVVTLGSFSKTVTPALGAGFVLLPPALRAEALALRAAVGPTLSGIVQRALADYLAAGGLRRHTERMRRAYRRRRQTVLAGLQEIAGVTVRGMDGGLHAVIEWDDSAIGRRAESVVQQRLSAAGIEIGTLSDYWARAQTADRSGSAHPVRYGLVIGYTAVDEDALRTGVRQIAAVLTGVAGPGPGPAMGSPAR